MFLNYPYAFSPVLSRIIKSILYTVLCKLWFIKYSFWFYDLKYRYKFSNFSSHLRKTDAKTSVLRSQNEFIAPQVASKTVISATSLSHTYNFTMHHTQNESLQFNSTTPSRERPLKLPYIHTQGSRNSRGARRRTDSGGIFSCLRFACAFFSPSK